MGKAGSKTATRAPPPPPRPAATPPARAPDNHDPAPAPAPSSGSGLGLGFGGNVPMMLAGGALYTTLLGDNAKYIAAAIIVLAVLGVVLVVILKSK